MAFLALRKAILYLSQRFPLPGESLLLLRKHLKLVAGQYLFEQGHVRSMDDGL